MSVSFEVHQHLSSMVGIEHDNAAIAVAANPSGIIIVVDRVRADRQLVEPGLVDDPRPLPMLPRQEYDRVLIVKRCAAAAVRRTSQSLCRIGVGRNDTRAEPKSSLRLAGHVVDE